MSVGQIKTRLLETGLLYKQDLHSDLPTQLLEFTVHYHGFSFYEMCLYFMNYEKVMEEF